MQEEELSEVFYKNGDIMLRVRRGNIESTATSTEQVKKLEVVEEEEGEFEIIRAPRPGTFYRAPAPDESPFVEVGVKVAKGDILCMIEAMKFYNKIHAEFSCEVVKIIAEDTKPVQYNDPLFKVKKTD
jgi:acetyl-CoA carboxylase biotin carboxyl carrier protein